MTNLLVEIKNSRKNSKALLIYLAGLIEKDPSLLADLEGSLSQATDAERGVCLEVLEHVSQKSPEIVFPYLDLVIKSLQDKAPRVKWEAARTIANLAPKYPEETATTTEALMQNTTDKGTVVRWNTALALGEIFKANRKTRSVLKPKIEKLIAKEQNSGVRNVYLTALKNVS